jgi:hypothetical protein
MSGTYIAPMPVTETSQFIVIAKDKDAEVGRSVVTLQRTQLKVEPATVELGPKQSVQFTPEPVALGSTVTWSSSEEESAVSSTGVLTTPESIPAPRTVVVTASWTDGTHKLHGSTSVKLSDPVYKFRAAFIAIYVVVFAIVLFITLGTLLVQDCLAGRKSALSIAPPVVTLRTNDTEQFQARLACASNVTDNAVVWQASAGEMRANGLYRAPADSNFPATATITAISKADSCDVAVATVFLSTNAHLEIVPSFLNLPVCQSYQFDVDLRLDGRQIAQPGHTNRLDFTWTLSPAGGGIITSEGLYLAPASTPPMRYVRVIAQYKSDPRIQGAALVELSGPDARCGRKELHQLIWVLALGALGSIIHCMRSLGDYLGNKKFVPSWFLYYLFKPFMGAGLAFVVVSQGALKSESGTISIGWGALAILVGLFSEQAVGKLSEIATTLFGKTVVPATDDGRANKMTPPKNPGSSGNSPAAGGSKPPPSPNIIRLEPRSIPHGSSASTLLIIGDNFSQGCRVKIGNDERQAEFEPPNKLKVVLRQEDIAHQGELKIEVLLPNGNSSEDVLKVS